MNGDSRQIVWWLLMTIIRVLGIEELRQLGQNASYGVSQGAVGGDNGSRFGCFSTPPMCSIMPIEKYLLEQYRTIFADKDSLKFIHNSHYLLEQIMWLTPCRSQFFVGYRTAAFILHSKLFESEIIVIWLNRFRNVGTSQRPPRTSILCTARCHWERRRMGRGVCYVYVRSLMTLVHC